MLPELDVNRSVHVLQTKVCKLELSPYSIMIRAVAAQRPHIKRLLATHASISSLKSPSSAPPMRHDWARDEIQKIYDSPLMDLVFRAAAVHRQFHDPSKIQLCTLMNIKSMFP